MPTAAIGGVLRWLALSLSFINIRAVAATPLRAFEVNGHRGLVQQLDPLSGDPDTPAVLAAVDTPRV